MTMASLFQFSIRSLLVAVTIVALGIAALLNASVNWEMAMWGLALGLLATAVLLIIYRRDQQRAFWMGFLVFGGLYLAVLLYSFRTNYWDQPTQSNQPLFDALPTTRLSQFVYRSVLPESRTADHVPGPIVDWSLNDPGTFTTVESTVEMPASIGPGLPNLGPGTVRAVPGPAAVMIPNPNQIPLRHFTNIGQALWLLLIAAAGGKVCQVICRTRPKETQS